MEAIQLLEKTFWKKCAELKCNKTKGFDYRNTGFFTNDYEIRKFEKHILPNLLENGYIIKPKPLTPNHNQRNAGKMKVISLGISASVYYFTDKGVDKLDKIYEQKLLNSENMPSNENSISYYNNYNIEASQSNININPKDSTIINEKVKKDD